MEDDSPMEAVNTPNTPRNLAAWKISIPYVDFFEDTSSERREKKERIPVFCIDVERNDRRAGIIIINAYSTIRSDQISCSVVSDSLRPHESQHARPPCPSPAPGVN